MLLQQASDVHRLMSPSCLPLSLPSSRLTLLFDLAPEGLVLPGDSGAGLLGWGRREEGPRAVRVPHLAHDEVGHAAPAVVVGAPAVEHVVAEVHGEPRFVAQVQRLYRLVEPGQPVATRHGPYQYPRITGTQRHVGLVPQFPLEQFSFIYICIHNCLLFTFIYLLIYTFMYVLNSYKHSFLSSYDHSFLDSYDHTFLNSYN